MNGSDAAFRWAVLQTACASVRSLAEDLASSAEGLVVFKGVHMLLAGADLVRRPIGDVDVAVVGDFDRCIAQLARSPRWTIGQDDVHSVVVKTDTGLEIDLHRRPLPARFGELTARALYERGLEEPRLGPRVRVPDGEDAVVLALANFVRDRLGFKGSRAIVEDLEVLRATGLGAAQVERRLRATKLFRVGLVAVAGLPGGAAREWLEGVSSSGAERVIAERLVAVLRHGRDWPRLTAWLVRALPDGAAGIASLGAQARESVGRNLRRWTR